MACIGGLDGSVQAVDSRVTFFHVTKVFRHVLTRRETDPPSAMLEKAVGEHILPGRYALKATEVARSIRVRGE